MTIFLALNEEFRAPCEAHSVSDFVTYVQSLTGDAPANQNVIRKEFEVKHLPSPLKNKNTKWKIPYTKIKQTKKQMTKNLWIIKNYIYKK